MNRCAIIAVVLCMILFFGGIIFASSQRGKQTQLGDTVELENTQVIIDTVTPKVELSTHVLFTNDMKKTDASALLTNAEEASEYTMKFIRFEKQGVLSTLDMYAVNKLEESVTDFRTKEEALMVGIEEIPTQPGIYRSVLEVADVHGNAVYKEVYVVLDKTGAIINDVEDMVVSVPAEKLGEKPILDRTIYKGYDEVDGILASDDFVIEVRLKDETKHEWTVTVAYTDRAGNESKREFLITQEEERKQTIEGNEQKQNDDANTNENKETINTEYDPCDTNKDGTVSGDEEARYITPEKQACIDAGYGVVVEMNGGEWYAVLMKNIEYTIDGKDGFDILHQYLKEKRLGTNQIGGGIINSDNQWYWFTAREIYELPDDDFNLEDGEWEFID